KTEISEPKQPQPSKNTNKRKKKRRNNVIDDEYEPTSSKEGEEDEFELDETTQSDFDVGSLIKDTGTPQTPKMEMRQSTKQRKNKEKNKIVRKRTKKV